MMMFASITPLLMTGSYAERVRWKSFFIITIAWEILVFYPVAHWMWGGGWLDK
jgi:Amt family ammonium transporter